MSLKVTAAMRVSAGDVIALITPPPAAAAPASPVLDASSAPQAAESAVAEVRTLVNGTVTRIRVAEGAEVPAHHVLVRIAPVLGT